MTKAAKLMLIGLFVAVCGIAALSTSLVREKPTRTDRSAIYRLIDSQIDALRAEDYGSAYRFASSGFHRKFDENGFRDLIVSGYSLLVNAERVEYGTVRIEGRKALVYVFLVEQDGRVVPCIYSLVREGGSWKVEGAKIFPGWPENRRLGGLQA